VEGRKLPSANSPLNGSYLAFYPESGRAAPGPIYDDLSCRWREPSAMTGRSTE